jgi:hypothetical protein
MTVDSLPHLKITIWLSGDFTQVQLTDKLTMMKKIPSGSIATRKQYLTQYASIVKKTACLQSSVQIVINVFVKSNNQEPTASLS